MWQDHKRAIILAGVAVVLVIIVAMMWWSSSTGADIRQARSGKTKDRVEAIDRLARTDSDAAAVALAELVEDADVEVAARSVAALGRVRRREAVPVLKTAVKDARPQVREAGVIALGELGRDSDPQALAEALRSDPSPEVRALAARWLGMLRYWEGMPELIQAMNDSELRVRRAAGEAVRRLWGRDFLYRAEDDPEKRGKVVEFIRLSWEDYRRSPAFERFRWHKEGPG
jgi:HEAT repeat protein